MTKTLIKAPFRADHVGSLLRTERINEARKDLQGGNITNTGSKSNRNRRN